MKKIFTAFALAIVLMAGYTAEAISRNLMKYQILVTDKNGEIKASSPVTLDFAIREGSADGEIVAGEQVTTTTSDKGIAYVDLGAQSSNPIENLDWSGKTYFLEIRIDRGSGMESLGSSQIMSVPRAIHSSSASSLILKSPSGKEFKVTIDDQGNLVANPVN